MVELPSVRNLELDRILLRDPAEVYERLDINTRNQYCEVIESWSRRSRLSAVDIAALVVDHAGSLPATAREACPGRHVGYFLLGGGAEGFRLRLCRPPRGFQLVREGALRSPVAVYYALLTLLVVLQLGGAVAYAAHSGAGGFLLLAVALTGLPLFCRIASAAAQAALARWIPIRILPKLAFPDGIPDDQHTL